LGWEQLKEAPAIGKLTMVGYHPSSSEKYPSSISLYFLWGLIFGIFWFMELLELAHTKATGAVE